VQQRLTHRIELSQTPYERFAHLQEEDRWLNHSSFDDSIHERLQILFLPYFHAVTLVDIGGREKDDCEGV
jgi:hypothetical protein